MLAVRKFPFFCRESLGNFSRRRLKPSNGVVLTRSLMWRAFTSTKELNGPRLRICNLAFYTEMDSVKSSYQGREHATFGCLSRHKNVCALTLFGNVYEKSLTFSVLRFTRVEELAPRTRRRF